MLNVFFTVFFALSIYALTGAGILAIWADETGMGIQLYNIGGLFLEGAAL